MPNPQSLCYVHSLSGLLGEKHGLDGKLQQILKLQQLEARFLLKRELSGAFPGVPQVNICGAWAPFSIYVGEKLLEVSSGPHFLRGDLESEGT